MMVSEFKENDYLNTQLLVVNVTRGNNNGLPYLNVDLRDASGQINGKKWSSTSEDDAIFVPGNVVEIAAQVIKYKDTLQLKITQARKLELDEVDPVRFIKKAPVPKEELIARLKEHINHIKDPDCHKLLVYFCNKFKDKLFDYPAAISVHHEYASGLLMHSVSMADVASFLADYYEGIDKDLLITGALLHDFGKMIEFEGPVIYKYSLEGKLLGHISIMAGEIRKAGEELNITSEVPLLLAHMVLSHHGQPEFGSPVLPMTKEAVLLNLIDNVDSKMVIVSKALENVNPGEFSQKVFPLDNRVLYKPKQK